MKRSVIYILAGVALSLLFSVAALFFQFYLPYQAETANYAVMDYNKAMEFAVEQKILAGDKDKAPLYIDEASRNLKTWLTDELQKVCPKPCVVFKREDVVYGDVIDLNRKFFEYYRDNYGITKK